MLVKTLNQGTLTFRPFNQTFHTRYGMYFKYYDSLEEAAFALVKKSKIYTPKMPADQD